MRIETQRDLEDQLCVPLLVMGWEDCHLHEFEAGNHRYGPRGFLDSDWTTPPKDESRAKLARVAPAGTRFTYWYNFGDDWLHEVVVEKVEKVGTGQPGADGPVCLSGRRTCPPEDSGGVWGYEHLLDVLADPEHPEREDLLDWVGDGYDSERFEIDEVNARLETVARALATAGR